MDILNKESFDEYEKYIYERCSYLIKNQNIYWNVFARSLYENFIQPYFNDSVIKWNRVKLYREIFPSILKSIEEQGFVTYNLKNKTKQMKAYFLGFPIHYYMPSDEEINEKIMELTNHGIDEYCNKLHQKNSNYIDHIKKNIINNNNIEDANTENLYGDEISSFNMFDVVIHCVDKHIYYFTRSEFEYMQKEQKNPYTNIRLPITTLYQINCRQNISKDLNLPNSKSIKLLLKDLDEEPEEEQEKKKDDEKIYIDSLNSRTIRFTTTPLNSIGILESIFNNFEGFEMD